MRDDLKNIGLQVETILREDAFPALIEPVFLREAVMDYPLRGGKRLRPALALWGAGAAGGDPARARFVAAAVEVWHNWTLVHDDIIDDDDFRRGVPSTHCALKHYAATHYPVDETRSARFGHDFAILTADLQQSWANHLVMRSREAGVNAETVLAILERMQCLAGAGVISGEAIDIEVEYLPEVTEATVERILYLKTGALLEFAITAGAMAGLNTPDAAAAPVAALGRFAAEAGIAFQLQDDWLGIYGDVAKFGKPLASDWKERKPTLLYLAAMRRATPAAREELQSLFGLPEYGEKEVGRLRELLEACGAAGEIQSRARRTQQQALAQLASLPDSVFRRRLEEMAEYLVQREV